MSADQSEDCVHRRTRRNCATHYGWRNGAKFTELIFIHIQCYFYYSRRYLFTFNSYVFIQEIYLFTFNGIFLIHKNIHSHLRDVSIHIQWFIFVHIHHRNIGSTRCNIHSTFSAHPLRASLGPTSRSFLNAKWRTKEGPVKWKCYTGKTCFLQLSIS